jgi:uncharacterized membrane protein
MLATAVDALFVHTTALHNVPNLFGFTPLHVLAVWTLLWAPLGVYFARAHNIRRHRAIMVGLFFGVQVIAGLFTLFPGRIMHDVFFG